MDKQGTELFNIVNEQDQVIGTLPRAVVHARNLLHRSVYGIVINSSGEIFLQFRAASKDSSPCKWDYSVSGHVDAGENYEQAIVRETKEELGLTLNAVPPRLFKLLASPESEYEFSWIYKIRDNGPFVLDPEEASTGCWFTVDEINQGVRERSHEFATSFILIWKKFISDGYINV